MRLFRWIRAVRKRRQRLHMYRSSIPSRTSEGRLNRRELLIRGAAATVLATVPGCLLVTSNEHGFNQTYSTRGEGGLRAVIEKIPHVHRLEIGFIKERGKSGEVIGASLEREQNRLSLGFLHFSRDPRSNLHTHVANEKNTEQLLAFPSVTDMNIFYERAIGTSNYPSTMKTIHIVPVTHEGKVMGYGSFRAGKKWIELEKKDPQQILNAIDAYRFTARAYAIEEINLETYRRRCKEIFRKMEKMGLQIRLTSMPEYIVKDRQFVLR